MKVKLGFICGSIEILTKIYVGSAVNLFFFFRFRDYYSPSYLKRATNYVCNTLKSYQHSAFFLVIIEYIHIMNLPKM
jgi:hypothetical protein